MTAQPNLRSWRLAVLEVADQFLFLGVDRHHLAGREDSLNLIVDVDELGLAIGISRPF
jgi:hypothetical protein